MLCNSCAKLALINANRICVRCKGAITNNLAVICDNCSSKEKLCAICLKKMHNDLSRRAPKSCKSCGK